MAFKKGCIPWNKGKKCPTISKSAKQRPMLIAGWNKGLSFEKQPRWNGGCRVFWTYQARKII